VGLKVKINEVALEAGIEFLDVHTRFFDYSDR